MVNTRDLCVVFLSFVLFVHHILSVLRLLLLFFFFFNWWSVCNFTEYVRRLDEILAQKIEKFTQLRGKTALLTFFSASLLACCSVKHGALCFLDLKGEFFNLWTKTYLWSLLLSNRVRLEVRLQARNYFDWWKESQAQKEKLDLLRLGHSCRQDPSLFSYTSLLTKRHWERNWT